MQIGADVFAVSDRQRGRITPFHRTNSISSAP